MSHINDKDYFDSAVAKIKSFGFRVFVKENKPGDYPSYWGYFSDGKNVGYFQLGWFFGVRWSTVNAPGSHGVGTGFSCEDDGVEVSSLTPERLREAFQAVPYWYRLGKNEKVVKFRDLDQFLEHHRTRDNWYNLIEV